MRLNVRDTGTATSTDVGQAIDRALREAGGGRLAGVRMGHDYGQTSYLVQFVRGSWLCTATVDVASGEVTSIVDDSGLMDWSGSESGPVPAVTRSELRLDFRTVWDVQAAADDPTVAYVATDAGISIVKLVKNAIKHEKSYTTGFGATRQVAPINGGVIGTTTDGRVFRIDRDGRERWDVRLPAAPYTVAAEPRTGRLLIATNDGALELEAATGEIVGRCVGTVRAAAYLPNGDRVLAGHRGNLRVVDGDGVLHWRWEQGEYPERLWVEGDRVYLAGEGGLKEIVIGQGVVARWSPPSNAPVESAVIAGGKTFTCTPGSHVSRHGYATAGYDGPLVGLAEHPEAITLLHSEAGMPWLLVAHRDGVLIAQPAGYGAE